MIHKKGAKRSRQAAADKVDLAALRAERRGVLELVPAVAAARLVAQKAVATAHGLRAGLRATSRLSVGCDKTQLHVANSCAPI